MSKLYISSSRLKCSPHKVEYIFDIMKNRSAIDVMNQLQFCRKKVAQQMYKVLKSAIHNAENNFSANVQELKVLKVDVGPSLKLRRLYPRARGRANFKYKRYSNVKITLI